MFQINGEIKNVFRSKTKKKGTEFTTVQVLCNGGKSMQLQNVTDWQNRSWEVGKKCVIPVGCFPWANHEKQQHGMSVVAL